MNNSDSPHEACSYWAENDEQRCQMTKGGLYIPMPEHTKMFCTTSLYSQCHQYIRGCELLNETARKYGFIDNGRRHYRRVPDRFSLSVACCDELGLPDDTFCEQVMALDLSLGGLRLKSMAAIPVQKLVAFTFGNDFSIPSLQGMGQIKWCQAASDDSQYFQSGLEFLDGKTKQAVGNHLGLPL